MLHPGLANELAKAIVAERGAGARIRRLPSGEVARVEARLAADRRTRAFERRLSAAGAAALLALVVLGPATVGAIVLTGALVVAIAASIVDRGGRPRVASGDRWQAWRRVEPDPEYLRGGAV